MPKEPEVPTETPRAVEMRRKRRQPDITIIASPVYDLLLSIHLAFALDETQTFDHDLQWIKQGRAACTPDVAAALAFFFGNEADQWCAASLCSILWRSPAPLDVEITLDWLAAIPVEQVMLLLMDGDGLGEDWREIAEALMKAPPPQGRSSRKHDHTLKVQAFTRRFPSREREAIVRFLTQPEEERTRLVTTIRTWYTQVFAEHEATITAVLVREAARLEKQHAEMPTEELFASIIHGIEYNVPAKVDRLIFAPSLLIMPSIFHFAADDSITYCYPITDSAYVSADREVQQREEMVRLFEALSDDTRIRILRHLNHRQMYLTELAEHLKLTKATTRHHMIRLRAAGLVTLHMRDHLSYYSLRRETLEDPTRLLLVYLDDATHKNMQ